MKKILSIVGIFVLLVSNAMADAEPLLTQDEVNKINQDILAKAGIHIPSTTEISFISGYTIINSKNRHQNKNDAYIAEKMQEHLAMHDEQQKNGYVNDNEPRAKELMELKHIASYHHKKYKDVLDFESTHIRASSHELQLAYTFMGVPTTEMDRYVGIAPYGAYRMVKNGDDADGWDGAVQFFDKNGIGSCAFTEHNRKLAHSGVELIKELVSYDIQNKPTIMLVKGTKETGFVYKLKWYDNTFTRELECANSAYNPTLSTQVIALANRIELYQQS